MDLTGALLAALLVIAITASFLVSASVGLGGSLLMVPTLVLVLGAKEGIALAALLLATNNVFKAVAYRRTIPWRASSAAIVALIAVGAFVGAIALVNAPESAVVIAVVGMFGITLLIERMGWEAQARRFGPALALVSGATSGFSGTSGPLKGAAIRNLGFDRSHFVGAASVASLVGDATKSAVFAEASLLGLSSIVVAFAAIPLMLIGTATGFQLNRRAGERGFALMFWGIMAGYATRLVLGLV